MPNKFRFDIKLSNVAKLKDTLPQLLANQAQNFFVDSFRKQGWEDRTLKKWPEVQRRIPGTNAYKYPKRRGLSRRRKPIEVMTGKYRRAVGNSAKRISFKSITFVVPLKYASTQNEGNKRMNIPERRAVGDSWKLRQMQRELIKKKTGGALNAK